jgi:ankyrin repeat protein
LVTLGASVEETNNREETPILAAALSGRIDNIFKLLELKSDALATDIQHRNILHKLFSINDNLEIKIDKTSNDFYESFSQLLDHLESKTIFTLLDQKDKANKKPIFYAINSNLNRVVNLLFDYNSRALDSERALRLAEKKNVAASKETVIQLQNNLKASKYFLAVAKKEMPKKSEELERANKKISHLKTEKEVLEEKINDLNQLHLKSYKKLENDLEKHNKMLVDSAFENGTRHQNLTRSIEEQKTEIHQLEFSLEEANTNIAEKDKIINTLLGEISGLKRSRDNKRSPSKGNKKSDVKPDEIQSQLYEGILSIRNESSNITYIDTNPLNKEQSNEVMNKESGYEGILKGFLPERNKFSEFGRTPEKAIVIEEEESNKKPAGEETKSVIDLTRDDTTTEFPEQGGGNVARMPRL